MLEHIIHYTIQTDKVEHLFDHSVQLASEAPRRPRASYAALARQLRPLVVTNILDRVNHGSEALVRQVILDELMDFLGVLMQPSFIEGVFADLLDEY